MKNEPWQEEFYRLMARFSHLGIAHDVDEMNLDERWGAYCFLKRIERRAYGEKKE